MVDEFADAIRDELREELIREHGSLERAAEALSMPYKTLYRALTTRGKDRSKSVKLELVIRIADHIGAQSNRSFSAVFSSLHERANHRYQGRRSRNASAPLSPRNSVENAPEDSNWYVF